MIPENFDNLLAANKFASEHSAVVEENATLRAQNAALRAQLECLHTQVDALNRETAMLRDILSITVASLGNV
jgi:cell division protein FtsB